MKLKQPMKLKRPRTRAKVACALAVLGCSALLAGGALASPAGASAGRAQPSKPAQRTGAQLPNLSALRARLRQWDSRPGVRLPKLVAHLRMRHGHGRPGVPQPDRLASAADAASFSTDVSPSNTFFLQLDVGGASTATGAGVIDWWSNGGANQNWAFVNVSADPNEFAIVNQNSGQCLTTNGYAGADVYQAPCDGVSDPNAQVWYTGLRLNTGSGWSIMSMATGFYLDVYGDSPWPGSGIDTWYWDGGANQYFCAC